MCTEHRNGAHRDLVHFVDKDDATIPERGDDVLVVNDRVAHVDRRAVPIDGALDDLDRTLDARTESTRVGQQDSIHCSFRS